MSHLLYHDMRIELRLPHRIDLRAALRESDEELDDVRSILSDVCHALEGQAELVISGFGQERWPVPACRSNLRIEPAAQVIARLIRETVSRLERIGSTFGKSR